MPTSPTRWPGRRPSTTTGPAPHAVIVPHAGYVYSGPVAASAYARILVAPRRDHAGRAPRPEPPGAAAGDGPSERRRHGHAARVGADRHARHAIALAGRRGVVVDDRPHAGEHSLEVHLPFLQVALGEGWSRRCRSSSARSAADVVADVLDGLWGGPETLVVVSTDLSHYHDHATAQSLDSATAAAVVGRRWREVEPEQACGAFPLRGLLVEAERRHLPVRAARPAHVGRHRGRPPVGSSATARSPWAEETTSWIIGRCLPRPADGSSPSPEPPWRGAWTTVRCTCPTADAVPVEAAGPGAAFVTLRRDGQLLGCIGSMEPRRSLAADVATHAYDAAFRDPRLPAVTADDWEHMDVEISVLGPLSVLDVHDRTGLLAALRPGRRRCAAHQPGGPRHLPAIGVAPGPLARGVPRHALAEGRAARPDGGRPTSWSSATRSRSSASTTVPVD